MCKNITWVGKQKGHICFIEIFVSCPCRKFTRQFVLHIMYNIKVFVCQLKPFHFFVRLYHLVGSSTCCQTFFSPRPSTNTDLKSKKPNQPSTQEFPLPPPKSSHYHFGVKILKLLLHHPPPSTCYQTFFSPRPSTNTDLKSKKLQLPEHNQHCCLSICSYFG